MARETTHIRINKELKDSLDLIFGEKESYSKKINKLVGYYNETNRHNSEIHKQQDN